MFGERIATTTRPSKYYLTLLSGKTDTAPLEAIADMECDGLAALDRLNANQEVICIMLVIGHPPYVQSPPPMCNHVAQTAPDCPIVGIDPLAILL